MAKPSLFSLSAFSFVLCLSFVAYGYPLPKPKPQTRCIVDSRAVHRPKATFNDLLNLLGTPKQAKSVNAEVAKELRKCFLYIVHPPSGNSQVNFSNPIEMVTKRSNVEAGDADDRQVWYGSKAIRDLAKLVIDSGGNPHAVQSALDPTPIPVPDVEGSKAVGCHLTRTPTCNRFINQDLNAYQIFLFNLIVRRRPDILLNRFDLFHGHLFITREGERVGILYHAKEYPRESRQFPYPMGPCQKGSSVEYEASQMNLRNILWLAPHDTKDGSASGTLLVLDANPKGIIYQDLIWDHYKPPRTIVDDDLGKVVVDSNYLNVGGARAPNYQLYVC